MFPRYLRPGFIVVLAFLACASDIGRVRGATPPKEGEDRKQRIDRYGDPLPAGAIARMGTIRLRTGLSSFALSRDGKILAMGEGEGVRLRRVPSWDEIRFVKLPGSFRLSNLHFSPDDKYLAATALQSLSKDKRGFSWGDVLYVAEVNTGRICFQSPPVRDSLGSVAFSPDGSVIAAVYYREFLGSGLSNPRPQPKGLIPSCNDALPFTG